MYLRCSRPRLSILGCVARLQSRLYLSLMRVTADIMPSRWKDCRYRRSQRSKVSKCLIIIIKLLSGKRCESVPLLLSTFDTLTTLSTVGIICHTLVVIDDISTLAEIISEEHLLARLSVQVEVCLLR